MIHIKLDKKAKDVISKTADLGSGSIVVTELPEIGEEHTIYELQEKKIIPSLIPKANQQMIDDKVEDLNKHEDLLKKYHEEMVSDLN